MVEEMAVGGEGEVFGFLGDEGEGGEDVGEFVKSEVVELGDEGVEFSAEACALGGIGDPNGCVRGVRAENFFGELVEFGRGANEARGTLNNRPKGRVFFGQAWDGATVDEKE